MPLIHPRFTERTLNQLIKHLYAKVTHITREANLEPGDKFSGDITNSFCLPSTPKLKGKESQESPSTCILKKKEELSSLIDLNLQYLFWLAKSSFNLVS